MEKLARAPQHPENPDTWLETYKKSFNSLQRPCRGWGMMPKILSKTPAWLCNPAPASELFTTPGGNHSQTLGPRRTIAQRGSEVFIAIGHEIRWAELSYLKNEWEAKDDVEQKEAFSSSIRSGTNRKPMFDSAAKYKVQVIRSYQCISR